jgi:hypothetical protein
MGTAAFLLMSRNNNAQSMSFRHTRTSREFAFETCGLEVTSGPVFWHIVGTLKRSGFFSKNVPASSYTAD